MEPCPEQTDRLPRDHPSMSASTQDLAKVSDSLSEKIFKEKVDQIEQTIKFCNFKISKGRELSITEIVELRKGGDDSLSNMMDVPLSLPSLSLRNG